MNKTTNACCKKCAAIRSSIEETAPVCGNRWCQCHSSITSERENELAKVKPEDLHFYSLKVGDIVDKVGGDYTFTGTVVAASTKLSGKVRVVVEDDRGILHIFSETNLKIK